MTSTILLGSSQMLMAFLALFANTLQTQTMTGYIANRVCYDTLLHTRNWTTEQGKCPPKELCKQFPESAKNTTSIIQLTQLMNALPAPFVVGTVGIVSDTVGRRPVLIATCVSCFFAASLGLSVAAFELPMWVFYFASAISGVSGGIIVIFMGLFASVSDLGSGKGVDRTTLVAKVEGSLFFGAGVGSLVFSQIEQKTKDCDQYYGYLVAVCMWFAVLLWTIFQKETLLKQNKRIWPGFSQANPLKSIAVLLRSVRLSLLAIVFTLQCCIFFGYVAVNQLFTTSYFEPVWSDSKYGNYVMLTYIATGVGSIFLIPILQHALGCVSSSAKKSSFVRDRSILLLTLLTGAVQMLAYGSVIPAQGDVNFALGVMCVIAFVQPPVIRSIVSKQCKKNELGQIFGAIAALEGAAELLWPILIEQIYSETLTLYAPAVYIFGAATTTVSFLIVMFALWTVPPETDHKQMEHGFGADDKLLLQSE